METLDQLDGYGEEQLEIWLEHRLRGLYSIDSVMRYRACDFRKLGVPFGESHIDGLVAVYKLLSLKAQVCFRDATEQLLRHVQPNDFPREAMSDLVLIIGLIRAHRALRAFVPVFGSGPWGELYGSLIYDAVSVLLMFERTNEAYDAARGLATSTNFPDKYIFDAYLVMVRSRPANWSADLALVRERFSRIQRRFRESGDPRQLELLAQRQLDLALSLVEAIPLADLAAQIVNLRIAPCASLHTGGDAWLLFNLFAQSKRLILDYSADGGNSLRLIDSKDRAREVPIPNPA